MSGNFIRSLAYLTGCVVFLICLVVCPKVEAQIYLDSTDWEGLKALYTSTGGATWGDTLNWNITSLEQPPSQESVAIWDGIMIEDGRVTALNLPDNGLTGNLPDELGNLSELRVLDLRDNALSDSIGSWIGSLTALKELYLQDNKLSGPIPDELGNLTNLEKLNLSSNQLEGTVPDSLTNLTNLRGLWLHSNLLFGSIPEDLIELPLLDSLLLGQNSDLSGVISMKDSTQFIDPRETNLCIDQTNMDPEEVSEQVWTFSEYACLPDKEWTALRRLYDSTNGREWHDDSNWDFNTRLRADSVGQWYGISVEGGSIRALKLERNNLDGSLPPELGDLVKLDTLLLDGNSVHGAIPEELFSLRDLDVFSASKTGLCIPNTAKAQSWLEGIPSVWWIGQCRLGPAIVSLPLQLTVIGLGLLGLLGIGTVLFMLLTQNVRSKELDPLKNMLNAVGEQLETLILNLEKHDKYQNDNAGEFKSTLENLYSDLTKLGKDIKDIKETDKLDSFEDKLVAIERQLETLIPNLEKHFSNQNDNAGEFKSALGSLHSDLTELGQDVKYLKENGKLNSLEDKLVAIERQLEILISDLEQQQHHQKNSAGRFTMEIENLHSALSKLIQDIKYLRENDGPDSVGDRLIAIERQLQGLILNSGQPHENHNIEKLISTIDGLRSVLTEREAEIKRLKQGYDNAIFRRFVTRFARVHQAVQYFLRHKEVSVTSFEQIHSFLESTLQECDVQSFSPKIGSDYLSTSGVADHPKVLMTSDRQKDYEIAEILEPGYIMRGGEKEEVLIPARVSVYRFKT